MMNTVKQHNETALALIIGANRGIGLALAGELARNSEIGRVIATHRPGRISEELEQLAADADGRVDAFPADVTDPQSLEALAAHIKAVPEALSLAIHAAGILHDGELQPEKMLEQSDPQHLAKLFAVNSTGPLMAARAILPDIEKRQPFTFAAISAMVGSIGDNRRGGWYGYRASKAALNQFMRTLSVECQRRWPEATVVAIHPGTTDTALSKPFQRNVDPDKLYSPEQTASRILSVLQGLGPDQTGRFYNWDGNEIPW